MTWFPETSMKIVVYAVLGLVGLASPVLAASEKLNLEAVNGATWSAKDGNSKAIDPTLVKAQVLLDRARFSPGVIDGHNGDNLKNAIKAFEKAHELKTDGDLDEEVWTKLSEASADPVLVEYTIA